MAKKQEHDDGRLRRHENVVAATDLPHVPTGTKGKVQLVNGLSWIRYWVRFENGEQLGQLNRDDLVRLDDWDFRTGAPKAA